MKKHRKGSVPGKVQDWLLEDKPWDSMIKSDGWCWLPLKGGLCIGLEWQGGYDKNDTDIYKPFMDGEYVLNLAVKFTDDFRINSDYAIHAGSCWHEEGFFSGRSLSSSDLEDDFYAASSSIADEYISILRKINLNIPKIYNE